MMSKPSCNNAKTFSAIGWGMLVNDILNASSLCFRCQHQNGNCTDHLQNGTCLVFHEYAVSQYQEIVRVSQIHIVNSADNIVVAKYYGQQERFFGLEPRLSFETYCRLMPEEMGFDDFCDEYYQVKPGKPIA